MAKTGMPWFRVTTGWQKHPKVQDFCLEIRQPLGAIYVVSLWDWTAEFYPSGDITSSEATIERALQWRGKAGALVATLITHRLLERTATGFTPHDWDEHNGAAYRKWETDRARRKAGKNPATDPPTARAEPDRNPTETRAGFSGVVGATVRNGTVRNEEPKNTNERASEPPPTTGRTYEKPESGYGGNWPPGVMQVHEHWRKLYSPDAKPTIADSDVITRAMRFGYTADELCESLSWWQHSPFHAGRQDGQTRTRLSALLKSSEVIAEGLAGTKRGPPAGVNARLAQTPIGELT